VSYILLTEAPNPTFGFTSYSCAATGGDIAVLSTATAGVPAAGSTAFASSIGGGSGSGNEGGSSSEANSGGNNGGLTEDGKVATGVTVGIGVPALAIAFLAWWKRDYWQRR
jgi:hypothetical protein